MNKNKNVWFYIFGVLSGLIIIPIIQELINVIFSWIQVLLIKPSKIIMKENEEFQNGQEDNYQETTCIGFHAPDNQEYLEEDYE